MKTEAADGKNCVSSGTGLRKGGAKGSVLTFLTGATAAALSSGGSQDQVPIADERPIAAPASRLTVTRPLEYENCEQTYHI